MKDILAGRHRRRLRDFIHANTLVVLDYDGTLAPIAANRERVVMRPATRRLLRRVAEAFPCAVLTGRARTDIARRLSGIPLRFLVGNHGLEWDPPLATEGAFRRLVAQWVRELGRRPEDIPGIDIEDKRLSLAIHLRRISPKHLGVLQEAVRRLPGARATWGLEVLNITPSEGPDKAVALMRMRHKAGADRVIFVGDDVTDEDVFDMEYHDAILGIRVGRKGKSSAQYYLAHQKQVDLLLFELATARKTHEAIPA